jgi:hypothetical protein
MWAFRRRVTTLARVEAPTAVDLVTTIVSPDQVTSPFTGRAAAAIHFEVFEVALGWRGGIKEHREIVIATAGQFSPNDYEAGPRWRSLGAAVVGDSILLRTDDGSQLTANARHAEVHYERPTDEGRCSASALLELGSLFERPSEGVRLWFRERRLCNGDRVRLRATVEPAPGIVSTEYRSHAAPAFATRGDLAAIKLDLI